MAMEDISGNSGEVVSDSDLQSSWDSVKEVPFRGDILDQEVTEKTAEISVESETRLRTIEEIEADFAKFDKGVPGIADVEAFLETGELAEGDNPEAAREIVALYDEYVTARVAGALETGDIRSLTDIASGSSLGGRYSEFPVGEATIGEIGSFFDFLKNDGYASDEERRKANNVDPDDFFAALDLGMNNTLKNASYGVPFTPGDVRQFTDSLKYMTQAMAERYPGQDLTHEIVYNCVANVALDRVDQALSEGKMKGIPLGCVYLFDMTLDREKVLERSGVKVAIGNAFCDGVEGAFGDQYMGSLVEKALFSDLTKAAVDELQASNMLAEISQDKMQTFGDRIVNRLAWTDDSKQRNADDAVWLTSLGYMPFKTNLGGILNNEIYQRRLVKEHIATGRDVDKLYHDALEYMRENDMIVRIVPEFEPSGKDEFATTWAKRLSAFNRVKQRRFYGEQVSDLITEDYEFSDYELSSDDRDGDRPLTETEASILETYLNAEPGERSDFKKFVFDSRYVLSDPEDPNSPTRTAYRYETIEPGQIKMVPELLGVFAEAESNTLNDSRTMLLNWLFYEDEMAREEEREVNLADMARDVSELFGEGKYDEAFSRYPLCKVVLFANCIDSKNIDEDGLTETQSHVLSKYIELNETNPNKSHVFHRFVTDPVPGKNEGDEPHPRYEDMSPEAIDECVDVLTALYGSNSSQLVHLAPNIASRLLESDPSTAKEKIEKLEHIFLRKSVPDFAKLYCCANVLYEHTIQNETDISPVLKSAEDTRSLLMTDLLKVSIRSNNRSLRSYLEGVIQGAEIEADYEAGGSLSGSEFAALGEFRDSKKFRTRFLGFARGLGFESASEVLDAMDSFQRARENQHRNSVERQPDGTYRLRQPIQPGDLIKGINIDFIHTMIQDGYNCPEMIGAAAKQDVTHWDTDFGSAGDNFKNLSEAIGRSMANNYGSGVYVVARKDNRFVDTYMDDPSGYTSLSAYEAYHGVANGNDFRGIRTGLGSSDVDFYVVRTPESNNTLRLKYELAKNGTYVPIVDETSEEVLFTPEEFDEMRRQFGGMSHYGISMHQPDGERLTDLDTYHFAPDLSLPDTFVENPEAKGAAGGYTFSELVANFDEKERETSEMQRQVTETLLRGIMDSDLPPQVKRIFEHYRTQLSGDSIPGTLDALSTGSTGRFTNKPGDADFDFVWRIDRVICDQYSSDIMRALTTGTPEHPAAISRFKTDGNSGISRDGIRKGVVDISLNGETVPVEVDISPVVKTDKIDFSSDQALEHRFAAIRAQDPEKYKQVIANIVIAKQLLKQGGAYKKGVYGDGGLGGIGVENWVLQHGGSLRSAAQSFLKAARPDGSKTLSFETFKKRYAVFDLGENHLRPNDYPFDNFVAANMTESGYQAMLSVCNQVIASH